MAADLIGQATAAGVLLEARDGGRLWADKPGCLPPALRDSLAAHRATVVALLAEATFGPFRKPPHIPPPARAALFDLPGVPQDWCEGVALLATQPAPDGITPRRWAALAATADRLLQDHGTALHGAGWDALDLFGLHATAPATNPSGWGLAWLLGEHGSVLDVSPDAVGLCRQPDGARLAYRRRSAMARAGVVPAWAL